MRRHPFLAYSAARLLLFAAAAGVLYLAGVRGVLLVGFALLVSGLISLWLLNRQRDELSTSLIHRARRVRRSLDEAAASEDEVVQAGGDGPPAARPGSEAQGAQG